MIEALELTNFKAFRQMRIELAPFTLLSGLNSSGKSSVLQCLALVRQSWEAGTLQEGGLLLNGELVELGMGRDVLHEDYVSGESGSPSISILIEAQGDESEWIFAYERDADLLRGDGKRTDSSLKLPVFGSGFQYIRADRMSPSVYYPRSYDRAVRKQTLGPRGEHTVNFLRNYADNVVASGRQHKSASSSRLLDQTVAWLQELCPGVNVEPHEIEGTDSVRLDYGFHGTAGIESSNRYRPTNVGFGLSYVLPVVVACLAAPPGALLLLENPEAHIHPRGQAMMARLCALAAADNVQIVCESHSDHFLNGMRIAVKEQLLPSTSTAILYFERNSGGRVEIASPRVGADGMLSEWPEGFFDEWDRAISRILDR